MAISLFRRLFKNKRKESCYVSKIEIRKKTGVIIPEYSLVLFFSSRFNKMDEMNPTVAKIINKDKLVEKLYSDKFINVKIQASVVSDLCLNLYTKPVYVLRNEDGTISSYYNAGTKLVSFDSGDIVDNVPAAAESYLMCDLSPNSMKVFSATFMKAESFAEIFEFLDTHSHGAFKKFYEKCLECNSVAELKDCILKNFPRFGCFRTGSVDMGAIPGYAHFRGKWSAATKEEELSNSAEFFDAYDGGIIKNAEVCAEDYSKYFGQTITAADLAGDKDQSREFSMKGSGDYFSKKPFDRVMYYCGSQCSFFGNPNRIAFVGDDNAFKMDFDESSEGHYEVLGVAKESPVKLSSQLAQSILFADPVNGKKVIEEIQSFYIAERLARYDATDIPQKKYVTQADVDNAVNHGYVDNIILSRDPESIYEYKALYDECIRQDVNHLTDSISRLSYTLKGYNRRLTPDYTGLITGGHLNRILQYGEIYINKKGVSTVAMIKYPKPENSAIYIGKNVSFKEVERRVNAAGLCNADAEAVLDFFRYIKPSVAVMPIGILIKARIAGFDFDYDGAGFLEYTIPFKMVHGKKEKKELTPVESATNKIIKILEKMPQEAFIIQR